MAFAPITRLPVVKPAGRGACQSAKHLSAWLWIATMTLSTVCSIALINYPVPAPQQDGTEASAR